MTGPGERNRKANPEAERICRIARDTAWQFFYFGY